GTSLERRDAPAWAVAQIHAATLEHDDLPAMDNADLRRGRPTLHIAFDEATAILAGDALQALAFHVLAVDPAIGADAAIRARLMALLTRACGAQGMVGGQALDITSNSRTADLQQLQRMHGMKTGALLRSCVLMAAAFRPQLAAPEYQALDAFATHIGTAFQVCDDILDVTATTEQLGKPGGSDAALDKSTYPALLGLDGARDHARQLHEAALAALTPLGGTADHLRAIAQRIIERDH